MNLELPELPLYKTVTVIDDERTGGALRAARLALGLSLRVLSKSMKCSVGMVWFLEGGRRRWSLESIGAYVVALKEAAAKE